MGESLVLRGGDLVATDKRRQLMSARRRGIQRRELGADFTIPITTRRGRYYLLKNPRNSVGMVFVSPQYLQAITG